MAGRPTKPLALVQGHRTKSEKQARAQAESKLLTGCPLKETSEVKANEAAHKEFRRVKRLLKAIDKDDDLFGYAINTHCLLVGEIAWIEASKQNIITEFEKTTFLYQSGLGVTMMEYLDAQNKLLNQVFACDNKIMQKRKMLNDIGRENLLTVQSALRSIPKKAAKKEPSALGQMLASRQGK